MSDRTYAKAQAQQKTLMGSSPKSSLLQRICACGQHTIAGGECSACHREQSTLLRSQRTLESPSASVVAQGNAPAQENSTAFNAAFDRASRFGHDFSQIPIHSPVQEHGTAFNAAFDRASRFGHDFSQIPIHSPTAGALQTKLAINQPGDHYEQEADRVAEQVMTMPAHHAVSGTPPRIQRFSGQSNGQMDAAPASVDQAIASPGRPLEPALRQDMEPRFGHDFSQVRVHSGAVAEQSARDVNAHAYTVGHNVVFGAGRFAPETHEGQRLIAHELTHVVQQTSPEQSGWTSIPQLQRKSLRGQAGAREATVEVRWSEDGDRFYDRVVAALGRSPGFRGIDPARFDYSSNTENTESTLRHLVDSFQSQYSTFYHRHPKEGESVKIHASAYYDPHEDFPLTNKKISFVEEHIVEGETQKPAALAQESDKHQPKQGETVDQRLARQTDTVVEVMSRLVAEADNLGYGGITFVIALTGQEIEPRRMEKLGPQKPHQSGTMRMSASMAAEPIRDDVVQLLISGPSEAEIEFKRDERGIMHWHHKWQHRLLPPPPARGGTFRPQSEREILDEYGIPNPQKMWAEIEKKWHAEMKDAAIMVGTFALTEIAIWIIGGELLKILGEGLVRLPRLYRLIRGGRAGAQAIEEGLAKLATAEAEELGQLLKRANAGEKLSAAEVKRLEELAARLESVVEKLEKFKIVEQEGNTRIYEVETEHGNIRVIGDLTREGETMHFKGVDIEGLAANKLGSAGLLRLVRDFAQEIAQPGVTTVVIEGAKRTTGPVVGILYRPWVIRVR